MQNFVGTIRRKCEPEPLLMVSLPCSSPPLAETERDQGRGGMEKTERVKRDKDRRERQREDKWRGNKYIGL